MHVAQLEVIHYPHPPQLGCPRFGWESNKINHPDWSAIESAIRQLDRDEWPYLWLHPADEDPDEPLDGVLTVMGGRGEYWLCLYKNGDEWKPRFPDRPGQSILIWESDQGSEQELSRLCSDIEQVLSAARHFANCGELWPKFNWDRY